ncbi:MAG: DUF4926 domain-containing protein [Leptolyngbyaceae cyanobacterium RU_5_1]|nr:DUF4926 domain-containing protein [Leptolyngbyaceae cyanobacterium RU_5_1]
MNTSQPKLLDTVALLREIPSHCLGLVEAKHSAVNGLPAGLVGTIVHIYTPAASPLSYLVEFSDSQGREYAMATLQSQDFLVLQYELLAA